MRTVSESVRAHYIATSDTLERCLEMHGRPNPGLKLEAERSLLFYEQGVWFEMWKRGIYWWWIGLLVAAVILIFVVRLDVKVVGLWTAISVVLTTLVYAATASFCQHSLERQIDRIDHYMRTHRELKPS